MMGLEGDHEHGDPEWNVDGVWKSVGLVVRGHCRADGVERGVAVRGGGRGEHG